MKTSNHFQKNFKFLSLTHQQRWYASKMRPLSSGKQSHLVEKLQAFRYSLILSLSLTVSLFLSPHLSHLIGSEGPSSHAGTVVPLSLLHCLISVSLATTNHRRDSLPQIFSHKRVLNGKEIRIVSNT